MLQVCNLRPGRTYAFKVVVQPVPTPFYGDIPPQQPSAEARFATVPTPPGLPEPARLVGRARNFLKVQIGICTRPGYTPGASRYRQRSLACLLKLLMVSCDASASACDWAGDDC